MTAKQQKNGSGSQLLVDVGPLLVFLAANFFAPVPPALKIFVATGAFMVAMIAAMLFSALRYRRISPLLWFSGVMVVILGGLTIWLHNEIFIKMKPTIYYLLVAAAEKFGLPIHAIGVGEKADDLRPFDPRAVARAIAGLPPE